MCLDCGTVTDVLQDEPHSMGLEGIQRILLGKLYEQTQALSIVLRSHTIWFVFFVFVVDLLPSSQVQRSNLPRARYPLRDPSFRKKVQGDRCWFGCRERQERNPHRPRSSALRI